MKRLFFLFLFCSAVFVPYFFRPYLIGYDSFHYLQPHRLENEPVLSFLVFNAIGGNIFVAKCALFLCLFGSVAAIALLGGLFAPENGWKAGLLVFLSPIFIFEALNFEGEQFSYPFLFLSLYFLFKDGFQNKIIACCLVLFASLFWQGSIIYLAVFPIYFLPALIPLFFSFGGSLQRARAALGNFLPKWGVQESAFLGSGITFHWGLLLGLLGFFEENTRKLLPAAVFFGIIAFLNAKFAVHLTPLLAAGLAVALDRRLSLMNQWRDSNVSTAFASFEGVVFGLLVSIVVVSSLVIIPFVYEPTQEQLTQVQLAVAEAKGETIFNDWQYGHFVEYFGGKALAKAGGQQPSLECHTCIVLSDNELNCSRLNDKKPFVYRC